MTTGWREALALARAAGARGEVPVGAIVVATARSSAAAAMRRSPRSDPTAHAEIAALREAAARSATTGFPAAAVRDDRAVRDVRRRDTARAHRAARLRRARPEDGRVRLGDRRLRRAAAQPPRDASPAALRADECGALLTRFLRRAAPARRHG